MGEFCCRCSSEHFTTLEQSIGTSTLCQDVQFFDNYTLYGEVEFIARIPDSPIDMPYSLPPPQSFQQNLLVQVKFIRLSCNNCRAVCECKQLREEHDAIAQLDRSMLPNF